MQTGRWPTSRDKTRATSTRIGRFTRSNQRRVFTSATTRCRQTIRFLHITTNDRGVLRSMPQHSFNLGWVLSVIPGWLETNGTLMVVGSYDDPNRLRTLSLADGSTIANFSDLTFDKLPPQAILNLGARAHFFKNRLWASLNFYNVLNQTYYYPTRSMTWRRRWKFHRRRHRAGRRSSKSAANRSSRSSFVAFRVLRDGVNRKKRRVDVRGMVQRMMQNRSLLRAFRLESGRRRDWRWLRCACWRHRRHRRRCSRCKRQTRLCRRHRCRHRQDSRFRGQHPLTQPMQPVSPPPVMPADVLPGSSMCRRAHGNAAAFVRAAGTSADGGNRGDSTAQPQLDCRWRDAFASGYLAAVIAGSVYLQSSQGSSFVPAMSAPSALRREP